ncbi:MAG TPA: Gfo/Idh/MocA family oxidoreductase, partial [Planctomycetaceae bacterium]
VAVMGLSRGLALAETFSKQPGVTVAAVCDADSSRMAAGAAAVAKLAGTEPRQEVDVRRLLDDDSIDALVCAAPNHWHGPATIMACAAGKHVYVEKPCCHNPAEGEMMIAAARKHDRCVQVGTQRRSNAAIQEGIRLLRDGAIGEPYYARAWYANQRGPIPAGEATDPPKEVNYDLWQGPAPRKPFRSNYLHYNWHWFWHWGNGELGNNGVHAIDLARWALGVDYPEQVVSSGGRYAYDDEQETPDTHVVGFKFPGGKQLMWEGLSCNRHGINKSGFGVTVHGNGGTLELLSDGYVLYDGRGKEAKKNSGGGPGDENHIANFVAAVRAGDPSLLNCEIETGHKSTLAPHLGNIAHRVGRVLTCDPANGHIRGDDEAMGLWSREYEKGWEPVV